MALVRCAVSQTRRSAAAGNEEDLSLDLELTRTVGSRGYMHRRQAWQNEVTATVHLRR
jgi:hypothetical protein